MKYPFLTIRLTGPMKAGKSFFAEEILKTLKKRGRMVYHHKAEEGGKCPSRGVLAEKGFSALVFEAPPSGKIRLTPPQWEKFRELLAKPAGVNTALRKAVRRHRVAKQ